MPEPTGYSGAFAVGVWMVLPRPGSGAPLLPTGDGAVPIFMTPEGARAFAAAEADREARYDVVGVGPTGLLEALTAYIAAGFLSVYITPGPGGVGKTISMTSVIDRFRRTG